MIPSPRTDKIRVSCRPDDKGYRVDHFKFSAFVDGVRIPLCYTADEEVGIAYAYKPDADGKPYIENGELAKIEIRGNVDIRKISEC